MQMGIAGTECDCLQLRQLRFVKTQIFLTRSERLVHLHNYMKLEISMRWFTLTSEVLHSYSSVNPAAPFTDLPFLRLSICSWYVDACTSWLFFDIRTVQPTYPRGRGHQPKSWLRTDRHDHQSGSPLNRGGAAERPSGP